MKNPAQHIRHRVKVTVNGVTTEHRSTLAAWEAYNIKPWSRHQSWRTNVLKPQKKATYTYLSKDYIFELIED